VVDDVSTMTDDELNRRFDGSLEKAVRSQQSP
jgi:hypothetical protein